MLSGGSITTHIDDSIPNDRNTDEIFDDDRDGSDDEDTIARRQYKPEALIKVMKMVD